MQKALTLLVILLICLGGCAKKLTSSRPVTLNKPVLSTPQEEQWLLMVGKWYGEQPAKEGGKRQWITEKFIDGTYRTNFKFSEDDGTFEESTEVGQWGASGPVYFTFFRGWLKGDGIKLSDPSDPYNYDAYRIIRLDKEIFEYEHFSTGNRFTVKKVAKDFELR